MNSSVIERNEAKEPLTGGRATGAEKALQEFERLYGCKPFEAPNRYLEWVSLLEKHAPVINRRALKEPKPQPMGERACRVLELLKASSQPLSLSEISNKLGDRSALLQSSLSTLISRNQVASTRVQGQGSRSKLVYSAVEVVG